MESTMDGPAPYQIRVPGELDDTWSDWFGSMAMTVESVGEGPPVTTLTGAADQAAPHSMLQRLYSLGLPLLSAIGMACGSES